MPPHRAGQMSRNSRNLRRVVSAVLGPVWDAAIKPVNNLNRPVAERQLSAELNLLAERQHPAPALLPSAGRTKGRFRAATGAIRTTTMGSEAEIQTVTLPEISTRLCDSEGHIAGLSLRVSSSA